MYKTCWRSRGGIATAIALSGLLICGSQAVADEPAPTEVFVPPAPVAQPAPEPVCPECDEINHGRLQFRAGYDIPTRYYFRGILQEAKGLINQPWAEVDLDLYNGDGALNNLTLTGSFWNSLHSQETGKLTKTTGPDPWYEATADIGFKMGLFDNTELTTLYSTRNSPNSAFSSVQEIQIGLGFDDSDLLGALALNPEIFWAIEVASSSFGPNSGTYMEIGLEPDTTMNDEGDYPVTLSLPVRFGFSLDKYYQDATGRDPGFGFFDIGMVGAMGLGFMPESVGDWHAHAGVHLVTLPGNTLRDVNWRGNDWDFYGMFGIGMVY
jgi:hypothetical protein